VVAVGAPALFPDVQVAQVAVVEHQVVIHLLLVDLVLVGKEITVEQAAVVQVILVVRWQAAVAAVLMHQIPVGQAVPEVLIQ
jgi:hypothetical protein